MARVCRVCEQPLCAACGGCVEAGGCDCARCGRCGALLKAGEGLGGVDGSRLCVACSERMGA